MGERNSHRGYLLAIGLALAGILLKIFQWYHSRPLWVDEEMVFLNVRDRAFSQLAGPLWLDQTAPLGWLALQRATLLLFGEDDRAVRAVSVLFGIGTLICAAWVGRRWMRPAGAALFVLLCSFSQWMIFYPLEAKPYATDAFWALLLPALAVWATQDSTQASPISLRRIVVWWITAAVAQWMSYGATFVAPACAILLCGVAWRQGGLRHAVRAAIPGTIWFACFSAHYYLVIRHARASAFLAEYWLPGLPPVDGGIGRTLVWLGRQTEWLAAHPGGTTLWPIFWLLAAYGMAVSIRSRPILALAWLGPPVSACLLAIGRLFPLTDRLALWIVPALYVAIGLAADDSVARARQWLPGRKAPAALASVVVVMIGFLCVDMTQQTRDNLFVRATDNHGLNDRAALRFLMAQREPGDVLITTPLGLPAVWWYGRISIADTNARGQFAGDGARVFVLEHASRRSRSCRTIGGQTSLQHALAGSPRVAIHLGFATDSPRGFQELVLDSFSEFARLVTFKGIASEGAVAIFDLASRPDPPSNSDAPALWRRGPAGPRLDRCVFIREAQRW